ncbi:MAG: chloride channel protein [Flavisolibacter sp.]
MSKTTKPTGLPVSISLEPTLAATGITPTTSSDKQRLFYISLLAILIAAVISFIAKGLIYLIDLVTNISFFGSFSLAENSPAENHLGPWVIVVPAIGGIVVGLMALYGSKAIRGHGIPEAMEQILTNQSRIKPTITYLKPVSSAISIGSGGPFGAEGPIIATGGALGSTLGQLLSITHNERKILLAAGATAGMSAIFGSPIAAIFLAVELLLFEFSPRSIIPVSLACITGAAGHHLLFGSRPVFEMLQPVGDTTNGALAVYSVIGLIIGLLSVLVTKLVYWVEEGFEKLPVHWMWWPAIGGLAVGAIGYFYPRTLGVGYNNITDVLNNNLPLQLVLSLCVFKFLSWCIALGSGTSGGTLAPLLTIGGAVGALLGSAALKLFPAAGINIPLAALVGMSALFAGASRAYITSIIFAIETSGQSHALLPLLATCSAAYIVSFFLMKNTIMTEKISRRGVRTPSSYEADMLENIAVEEVMEKNGVVFSEDSSIAEVITWLDKEPEYKENYFIISSADGVYRGIISASSLYNRQNKSELPVGRLIKRKAIAVRLHESLRHAVGLMAAENVDVMPVLAENGQKINGIISYKNILSSYKRSHDQHRKKPPLMDLKKAGPRILQHDWIKRKG